MSVHQCTPGFIVGRMWYAEDQDLLLMTYGGFLCRSCGVAPRVGCSTQGEGCRGRGSSSVATSCLRLEPVAVVPEGSCTPGGCACSVRHAVLVGAKRGYSHVSSMPVMLLIIICLDGKVPLL